MSLTTTDLAHILISLALLLLAAHFFGRVFGIAIAVTSIPVISRILLDLGLLDTTFARIVLAVAVLEDVVLYVVLAVALGLGQAQAKDAFGLWPLTGIDAVVPTAAYH